MLTRVPTLGVCTPLLFFFAALSAQAGEKESGKSMVYELRTYTTADGRLPALNARFRDHTLKLFEKHGITNVIYWTPADTENTLVYLIAHKSREAADDSWRAFVDDPEWKEAKAESVKNGKIVTKVERQYLTPTDYSPAKTGGLGSLIQQKGLAYELRTYTTNDGKLDDLHARFRDHTMKLFEKHGITNVIYTTPLEEKTSANTLVYVVAHKSRKGADVSWKKFIEDPEWKQAYRKSIENGKLVTKIENRYLTPTDYSPVK